MPSPNEHHDSGAKDPKPVVLTPPKRRGNDFTDALNSIVQLSTSFDKKSPRKGVEKGIRSMMNNLAGNDLEAGFGAMLLNAAEGGDLLIGLEKIKSILGQNFLSCVADVLGENNKINGVEKILSVIGKGKASNGIWLIMNQNGKQDYKDLGIFASSLGEGRRSEGLSYVFEALQRGDKYKGFVLLCEIIKEISRQNSNLKVVSKLCMGIGLGNAAIGLRDIINAIGAENALGQIVEFVNPDNHSEALTHFMAMLSSEFSVGFQSLIASAGGGFANKNGLITTVGIKGLSNICTVLSQSGDKKEGFTQLLAMQGGGVVGLKNIIVSLGGKDKQKGLTIICVALSDSNDKTKGFSILLDIIGENNKEKGLTAIIMMLGGS